MVGVVVGRQDEVEQCLLMPGAHEIPEEQVLGGGRRLRAGIRAEGGGSSPP